MVEDKVSDREQSTQEEVDRFLRQTSQGKVRAPEFPSTAYRVHVSRTRFRTPLDALGLTMAQYISRPSSTAELSSTRLADELRMLASSVERMKRELISSREKIESLQRMLEERPIVKETRIYDIGGDLQVIEAIPVVIEETEDEVIASFPEVEVYGVGASEPEALSSLKAEIRDLYFELTELSNEELGSLPLGWRRVLERLVRRVE